jgi:hypothetical protein
MRDSIPVMQRADLASQRSGNTAELAGLAELVAVGPSGTLRAVWGVQEIA